MSLMETMYYGVLAIDIHDARIPRRSVSDYGKEEIRVWSSTG